jgi:hypothetical protein
MTLGRRIAGFASSMDFAEAAKVSSMGLLAMFFLDGGMTI